MLSFPIQYLLDSVYFSRLSNEKPSAIFRLRGTYTVSNDASGTHAAFASAAHDTSIRDASSGVDVNALLGISIETLPSVLAQCGTVPAAASSLHSQPSALGGAVARSIDPTALGEKIVKHLFNYISSFATGGEGLTPDTYIPLGAITKWYDSFLGKVKASGIGFLERDD